jgi:DNA topoisomerase IA
MLTLTGFPLSGSLPSTLRFTASSRVTDFLTNHFNEIVNLGFTAKIERNFDRIARGEEGWMEMMEGF